MYTQINNLLYGGANQILNPHKEYPPRGTYNNHHGGSHHGDVRAVWRKVVAEHPEHMTIKVLGLTITLTAHWSKSRLSVTYRGELSPADLERFGVVPAKDTTPTISVYLGNHIEVSNGKKSFAHVCPSLVEIVDDEVVETDRYLDAVITLTHISTGEPIRGRDNRLYYHFTIRTRYTVADKNSYLAHMDGREEDCVNIAADMARAMANAKHDAYHTISDIWDAADAAAMPSEEYANQYLDNDGNDTYND